MTTTIRRSVFLSILIFSTLFSGAAFAGTVYVPWTTSWTSNGVALETTVRITNRSDGENTYTVFYLPADSNGISTSGTPVEYVLDPHATDVFTGEDLEAIAPVGEWGLLEIVGEGDLHVVSHLSGDAGVALRAGSDLPPASSENLTAAGATSVLQGLRRSSNKVLTDLMVMNLGTEPAFCAAELRRRSGLRDGRTTFTVAPLSLRLESDILGELGPVNSSERSLFLNCDRDTYAFAVRRDLRNGEIVVVGAGADESTLTAPGRGGGGGGSGGGGGNGGGGGSSSTCAAGTVFEAPGDFHRVTWNNAKKKFKVFQAGRQYTRIVLEMEFTHGGWHSVSPGGNHAIFWLHRDKENRWAGNVFGYLNIFGPNKNYARLGTNITHNIAPQISKSATLHPGRTYQVRYVYDTNNRVIRATISENGQQIVRIDDNRTPNIIDTESLGMFLIFGHPVENNSGGPEVPTIGWTYSNLCVWAR